MNLDQCYLQFRSLQFVQGSNIVIMNDTLTPPVLTMLYISVYYNVRIYCTVLRRQRCWLLSFLPVDLLGEIITIKGSLGTSFKKSARPVLLSGGRDMQGEAFERCPQGCKSIIVLLGLHSKVGSTSSSSWRTWRRKGGLCVLSSEL